MFTGVIETTGEIGEIITRGSNRIFWIRSSLANDLRIDQSLSHDGICLTIEEIKEGMHRVTAIKETLLKTNLRDRKPGDLINLERCLTINGRLDGHLVQGHVDSTSVCKRIRKLDGSWEFDFEFPKQFSHLLIEKGSICLNGISLTTYDVKKKRFRVAIIPYTFEHTNMNSLACGEKVNLEYDIIGKYVNRNVDATNNSRSKKAT